MAHKEVLIHYKQGKGAVRSIRSAITGLYRKGQFEFMQLENGIHIPLDALESVDGVRF